MRKGYIKHTLTPVDNQEIGKIGGKAKETYEGFIYRENYILSPFRKVIVNLFTSRRKYNDENNDLMEFLVKLKMNSLHGENIRKDIAEKIACRSEYWTMTE